MTLVLTTILNGFVKTQVVKKHQKLKFHQQHMLNNKAFINSQRDAINRNYYRDRVG